MIFRQKRRFLRGGAGCPENRTAGERNAPPARLLRGKSGEGEHPFDGLDGGSHDFGRKLDLRRHVLQAVADVFEGDFLHVRAGHLRLEREELPAGILLPEPVQDADFGADDERLVAGFPDVAEARRKAAARSKRRS